MYISSADYFDFSGNGMGMKLLGKMGMETKSDMGMGWEWESRYCSHTPLACIMLSGSLDPSNNNNINSQKLHCLDRQTTDHTTSVSTGLI